ECVETSEDNSTVLAEGISGTIALDQASCPLYMVDGHVTNCRCYVTARGRAYFPDISVAWRKSDLSRGHITTRKWDSTVIAFKYTGTRFYSI
ncbi:hypothetical protein RRG08_058577, partial [Elysia crispata]